MVQGELRFDGKVAIVTGGGRGLGREYARLLGARGCRVVVNDPGVTTRGQGQEPGAAVAVAQEIVAAGGIAVGDRDSVIDGADAIAAHAIDEFGRIDIVVNNAGISGGGAFDEMPAADFDRLVDTHYGGAVRVSRAAWPHLKAAGAGRIVNMSSASVFGTPFTSPYVSSKAGIFGLTRALAAEGAYSGILVNAVMPAAFTRMTAQLPDDGFRGFLETYFPPDKVAPFVIFLAHESTTINGETFSVGAGRAARVFLAECPGVIGDGTPESFAGRVDDLMSIEGWEIPSDMMDEVRYSSDHLGPDVAAAYAHAIGARVSGGAS
jgi:NAD(P)-dependent dehydrogenase (short-subunit alcohol dehydrogenase family)